MDGIHSGEAKDSDTQRMVAERTVSIRRTVVEEHGFNTGGGGKEGSSYSRNVVERTGQEVA